MIMIPEKSAIDGQTTIDLDAMATRNLRIAFCLPEEQWIKNIRYDHVPNAAYIQQGYIARGLQNRGHYLTYFAQRDLSHVVYTDNLERFNTAKQTWSGSRWFDYASKGAWRFQQWLNIPYLNFFSNLRQLDAYLQCLPEYDLVHERNGIYKAAAAMACKRLQIPYVIFFDADQIMELDFLGKPICGLLRWRAKGLLRYNLNVADCIICVSAPSRENLIDNWNVPEEKIVVFPNGVDVQRFQPDPGTRADLRASLGIGSESLIVFVGNFYDWHDVETLLAAFAQVLLNYPDARLILAGDGPQRPAIMRSAVELGVNHAVEFRGLLSHTQIPGLLAAADIAVAPVPEMKQDLWLSPMKLFEYMASGVAVVASNVGQISDVIQHGHSGLLVKPGDRLGMASAFKRLIDDDGLRMRIGKQAREEAVRKYSWDKYILRLERVYMAVIEGQAVDSI